MVCEQDSSSSDSSSDSSSESSSADSEEEREERLARQKQLREARLKAAMESGSKDHLRSPICCILGHVDTGARHHQLTARWHPCCPSQHLLGVRPSRTERRLPMWTVMRQHS